PTRWPRSTRAPRAARAPTGAAPTATVARPTTTSTERFRTSDRWSGRPRAPAVVGGAVRWRSDALGDVAGGCYFSGYQRKEVVRISSSSFCGTLEVAGR